MWLLISFVIVVLGGVNWLLIGLLQYDFVAGVFGFQSSLLSRIVYIAVGIATVFLIFKTLVLKGKLNLFTIDFKRLRGKKEATHAVAEVKEEPVSAEEKIETGSLNDFK